MRLLIVIAMGGLLLSCGGSDRQAGGDAEASGSDQATALTAEEDLAILGREIFDLVDRAMSYRSAHRGQLPRNLRELGIDELTPSTTRSLTVAENVPTVTVGFRSPAGHTVSSCQGTNALLEEAALAGGSFSLICNLVSGGTTTLQAQR